MCAFKYLGTMVDQNADCSREIRARLGAARAALRDLDCIWKDRTLAKKLNLMLLRTLVWPIAVYGCEAWTLKVADTNRLHAFETRCYRGLLHVTWRERRTNQSILQELNTDRLFILEIRRRKLRYFGHVVRADSLCTYILQGHLACRQTRPRSP